MSRRQGSEHTDVYRVQQYIRLLSFCKKNQILRIYTYLVLVLRSKKERRVLNLKLSSKPDRYTIQWSIHIYQSMGILRESDPNRIKIKGLQICWSPDTSKESNENIYSVWQFECNK